MIVDGGGHGRGSFRERSTIQARRRETTGGSVGATVVGRLGRSLCRERHQLIASVSDGRRRRERC